MKNGLKNFKLIELKYCLMTLIQSKVFHEFDL